MVIRSRFLVVLFSLLMACARSAPTDAALSRAGYSAADLGCMAEALYFEARGTGYKGARAVGEVILNRAADSRFPAGICAVVDQRSHGACQFSYRCDAIPNSRFSEPAELVKMRGIAYELLTNRGADITRGALYFHAATMAPGWFASLSRRGQFGGNIFYR
jgi:spore germination cell wall hydrolase CwlJ-like protein